MKKLLLLLSVFLSFCPAPVKAENITRETAGKMASQFFLQQNQNSQIASRTLSAPVFLWDSRSLAKQTEYTVSSTEDADEMATFYVFGPGEGKGFVIISADDAALPVLGYSLDHSAPSACDIPENMAVYLKSLSDEINHARGIGLQSAHRTAVQPLAGEAVGQVVVNLNTAEWGQFKPFNLKCPQDNGSHCATGCIPTAFSIIMQHHQWPDCGEGILPAYLSGSKAFQIEECDLSQHTYRWDQMLHSYNDVAYTDEQADAVALLMADAGHCFEVIYGVGDTGGYHSTSSFRKFLKHFKYDASGERIDRDILLNDNEWIQRIKQDLDASRPIAYSATSATNANQPNGRHIFVCDGYTNRNYFHFNWGWGGNGNGYFALSAMNPNQNFNFVVHHIAYFNIIPLKPAATYTVNVSATEGGTARVDGRPTTTVKEGETVRLTARAQYDHRFTHWSVDGTKVSEAATYEPVITANTDFVAHFVPKETGIGNLEDGNLKLSTPADGTLHIDSYSGPVQVYDIQGKPVCTVIADGSADIQLPAGIYLVKAGSQHYKISIP